MVSVHGADEFSCQRVCGIWNMFRHSFSVPTVIKAREHEGLKVSAAWMFEPSGLKAMPAVRTWAKEG